MGDCKLLHETIVRDILDVMDNIKNHDQVEWLNKRYNSGSIARRASHLILTFPVMVSTSLNIQTATIISKAIERKCVSLLQILFSSVQFNKSSDLYEYINQFHSNLDTGPELSLDNFMNTMDRFAREGTITVTDRDAYEAIREDMKNINFSINKSLNPVAINDYKQQKNAYGESGIVLEAPTDWTVGFTDLNTFRSGMQDIEKRLNNVTDKKRTREYNDRYNKDTTEFFKNQLLSSDVQKANELMPTSMLVNFTSVYDGAKINTTGVIGVKAKIYPVADIDIIARLSSKVKDKNGLFNLIRATTREISFFRDFMFAVDKAKLDAINMARDSNNARLFKVLERRAAKNRFSSLLKKNDASPITSLVISQEDVEYLKKYNNLDMEKPHNTRVILEAYNLMDIVIADETLELAKFMYDDGEGVYEVLPFDALEKEAKDSSYKKVVNLMSKITR